MAGLADRGQRAWASRSQGLDQPGDGGSEATVPNTCGSARSTATSDRQSRPAPPPARIPAEPCPGRAPPATCATASSPTISPCPTRPCGRSPEVAPHRPARPPRPHRPGRGQTDTDRYACSPGECFSPCSGQSPWQVPLLQLSSVLRLSDQDPHKPARESPRLEPAVWIRPWDGGERGPGGCPSRRRRRP